MSDPVQPNPSDELSRVIAERDAWEREARKANRAAIEAMNERDELLARVSAPTPDHDRIAQIKARLDAATPGPWQAAIAPAEGSSETKAEYQNGALLNGDEPLWVAWAQNPTDDGFTYVVPAITGDGPTSRANAEFIANARADIEWLIERLSEGAS